MMFSTKQNYLQMEKIGSFAHFLLKRSHNHKQKNQHKGHTLQSVGCAPCGNYSSVSENLPPYMHPPTPWHVNISVHCLL